VSILGVLYGGQDFETIFRPTPKKAKNTDRNQFHDSCGLLMAFGGLPDVGFSNKANYKVVP
jgi:hypothetical protein